jgi:hypothetical protein
MMRAALRGATSRLGCPHAPRNRPARTPAAPPRRVLALRSARHPRSLCRQPVRPNKTVRPFLYPGEPPGSSGPPGGDRGERGSVGITVVRRGMDSGESLGTREAAEDLVSVLSDPGEGAKRPPGARSGREPRRWIIFSEARIQLGESLYVRTGAMASSSLGPGPTRCYPSPAKAGP